MAAGAPSVSMAVRMTGQAALSRLDDFVRPDAARAHAHAPNAAVDDRADGLDVDLEPAPRHVMSMTDVSSDCRAPTTNLTTLGHVIPNVP